MQVAVSLGELTCCQSLPTHTRLVAFDVFQEEHESLSGDHMSAWSMLRQLVRCIQPYLHPSNSGSYTPAVSELLQAT